MDSSIHHKVEIPAAADCICRFCMLPCEDYEALRIPWNEWEHSLLAAMYARIMNKEVSINVSHTHDLHQT